MIQMPQSSQQTNFPDSQSMHQNQAKNSLTMQGVNPQTRMSNSSLNASKKQNKTFTRQSNQSNASGLKSQAHP